MSSACQDQFSPKAALALVAAASINSSPRRNPGLEFIDKLLLGFVNFRKVW
jgi:hypothetical protein